MKCRPWPRQTHRRQMRRAGPGADATIGSQRSLQHAGPFDQRHDVKQQDEHPKRDRDGDRSRPTRALLLFSEPDAVLEFPVDWIISLWVHGEIILRPEDPESSAILRPCGRPTAWRTVGTDKGSRSRTFACWRRG